MCDILGGCRQQWRITNQATGASVESNLVFRRHADKFSDAWRRPRPYTPLRPAARASVASVATPRSVSLIIGTMATSRGTPIAWFQSPLPAGCGLVPRARRTTRRLIRYIGRKLKFRRRSSPAHVMYARC